MISIQTALLVGLGFLIASLLVVLLTPAYRSRTVRLTAERIRASLPVTEQELKADKDRIRAENAMRVHRLEQQLDQFKFGSARQLVEVSRRDGTINTLTGQIEQLKTEFDAAQNARNVLEQTIADRLPRVEQRLIEAKKLLFQRDRDIAALNDDAARTQRALVEAVQINAQQRAEIDRLTMVLETRGAQNRDGLSDPTFDAELAMKSEIEALRARGRDQASLIDRLRGGATGDGPAATSATDISSPIPEVVRMQRGLLTSDVGGKASPDVAAEVREQQHLYEVELRQRDQKIEDQTQEIARLTAALGAYQDDAAGGARASSIKDSKIAMKSRLSALQVQTEGQAETIRKLRSEVASSNERLARQAQHFMEEMRRLGAGTLPATGASRRPPTTAAERRSLTQRITEAKPDLALGLNGANRPVLVKSDAAAAVPTPAPTPTLVQPADEPKPIGAAKEETADIAAAVAPAPEPEPPQSSASQPSAPEAAATVNRPAAARPRLLDRITDYGKG